MEPSPHKIKEKLLDALDEDYNVVDMVVVIEVIAILERIPVSKDLLEETRLGKHINELRKKTKDVSLAKRAKNLVRRWRSCILPTDQNSQHSLNGDRNTPKIKSSSNGNERNFKNVLSHSNQSSSFMSINSKPNSPMIVTEKCVSPVIGYSSASNSPSSFQQGRGLARGASPQPVIKSRPFEGIGSNDGMGFRNFKPISPALNHSFVNSPLKRPANSPLTSNSPVSVDGQSRSPIVMNSEVNSSSSRTCSPVLQASHATLDLDRTNAANKRLRKELDYSSSSNDVNQNISNSVHSPALSASLVNGLSSKLAQNQHSAKFTSNNHSMPDPAKSNKRRKLGNPEPMDSLKKKLAMHAKTHKVKTTAQLIADLQARNSSPILKSSESVLSEIRQNKSLDDSKKNSGKYSALADSVAEVKKTKSELMEKFLSSSPSPLPDSQIDSHMQIQKESPIPPPSIEQISQDPSPVPETSFSEKLQNVLSQLPDIDVEDMRWDSNDQESVATPATVNDESINKLHIEKWPQVNGNFSANNVWTEWHEVSNAKSYQDDLLNILPYVNID